MPHDRLKAGAVPAVANTSDMDSGPTTHRLATVSASSALQRAASAGSTLSTGSSQVDSLLAGGLSRGKVVEVYGPSGAGKTMLGITAAANALARGGHVVWIDCTYDLATSCLREIILSKLASKIDSPEEKLPDIDDAVQRFHHYHAPTLAQLVALIMRSPVWFPPPETHLIVVDGISGVLGSAFPRSVTFPSAGPVSGVASFASQQQQQQQQQHHHQENPQQWAASRRWALQRDVVATLNKLAGVHYTAVLVISQTATRIDRDTGGPKSRAVLRPAINTRAWNEGFWARIILLRHWGPKWPATRSAATKTAGAATDQAESVKGKDGYAGERALKRGPNAVTRFAGLVKLGNIEYEAFGRTVMYDIGKHGLTDAHLPHSIPDRAMAMRSRHEKRTPQVPTKRNASEIANSESEGEDPASSSEEVEELDEMGLSREEAALLELELTGTMEF